MRLLGAVPLARAAPRRRKNGAEAGTVSRYPVDDAFAVVDVGARDGAGRRGAVEKAVTGVDESALRRAAVVGDDVGRRRR